MQSEQHHGLIWGGGKYVAQLIWAHYRRKSAWETWQNSRNGRTRGLGSDKDTKALESEWSGNGNGHQNLQSGMWAPLGRRPNEVCFGVLRAPHIAFLLSCCSGCATHSVIDSSFLLYFFQINNWSLQIQWKIIRIS